VVRADIPKPERTADPFIMASALQSDTPSVLGGPLVDLNGKVIGLTIGGSGSSSDVTGYAIPINTALADARQMAAGGFQR
jgi:S1-C subfamily serine protease